jgi:Undecaprenyl-phosphate galactose phosphotransferase WbaP
VKGQTEAGAGEMGAAMLGPSAVGGGIFQSGLRFDPLVEEVRDDSRKGSAAPSRAFTRRVGLRYSIQVALSSLPLLLVDVFALAASVILCRQVFSYLDFGIGRNVFESLLTIIPGFVVLNFVLGLYPGARVSPVEELRRLIISVTCIFFMWAIGTAVASRQFPIDRTFVLAGYGVSLVVLPIARSWARTFLARWTRWGLPVLVCGDEPATVRLFHWLSDNRHLGLRPLGVIADRNALAAGLDDNWYLGTWDEIPEVAAQRGVFWAVVMPPESRPAALSSLIADYLYTIPHVHVVSELTGLPDHWNPQQLDGLTGIHLQQNLMLPLPRVTKRCMDFFAAVAGGIVLLPLLFYLAVAVKMSSRGPIFYAHQRIGRNGRLFRAWKFRTMFSNANLVLDQYLEDHPELQEEWQRDHKLKVDPRVTRIGRFLRKTSLDELPQLWNVIRGDMSLVGPRPIVHEEVVKYGPYYHLYTMVKPGITGLWQVSGRNNTTYDERVQLDAYYVRNWSPWIDIFLLLKTIRIVLFARGAY